MANLTQWREDLELSSAADTDGQQILFVKARLYDWDPVALQWVRHVAVGGSLAAEQGQGVATLTTTGTVSLLAAPGAAVRWAITHIHVSNTSATAVRVDIMDNATPVYSTFAAASGGGAAEEFSMPLYCGLNNPVQATLGAAVTDVRVTVVGFKSS
jgi:hypothetical protein